MNRGDQLDLAALRRSAPKASAFVVLASDGTVIDTRGFVRGSIIYAALPAGLAYGHPVHIKSALGEEWYLVAKKVKGGSIIVGESSIISPPDINARLLDSAKRLGNSIESAMIPVHRDPNASVDFAVLGDDGILLDDYGGIPLKARKTGLLFAAHDSVVTVSSTAFLVRKIAIMDPAKHQRGTILVTKDVEPKRKCFARIASLQYRRRRRFVCLVRLCACPGILQNEVIRGTGRRGVFVASAPLSPRCSLGRARKMAEDIRSQKLEDKAALISGGRQRNRSCGRCSLCRAGDSDVLSRLAPEIGTHWWSGMDSNCRFRLFSAKTANFFDFPFSAKARRRCRYEKT